MSVCFFNRLPHGKYLNILNKAAYSCLFSTSSTVKNSYLQTFTHDKVKILAV